jgi:hypothetical protein
MNATILLDDLRRRGVTIAANGDRLSVDAPKGALTDELRRSIPHHKADLLALLEAEAARDELERLEARLGEMNQRLFELFEDRRRDAAKRLQDELRRLVGEEWLPARVRLARLEHRLGRLDPSLAFLLESADEATGVNGYRRVPGGWVETEERAAGCVIHADRPLAPGNLLYCVGCRAAADAMPATAIDGVSLPVPPGVAPDDPRLREWATVAALAAAHRGAAGEEGP